MDRLGVVALDGTKVKANASLAANRTAKSFEAEVEPPSAALGLRASELVFGIARSRPMTAKPSCLAETAGR